MRRSTPLTLSAFLLSAALLAGCGARLPFSSAPPAASTPAANAPTNAPAVNATNVPAATSAPAATGDINILEATYARKLSENKEPVDPTKTFEPGETINISLRIEGRPKQGEVKAVFYWRDEQIVDAKVDLADANSGVLFSIGQSTFVGFTLTPTQPFPVSPNYRTEVYIDGKLADSYPFSIVAGPGASAPKVKEVVLARGSDAQFNPIEPGTEFAPDTEVTLLARGDYGKHSWAEIAFYAKGEKEPIIVKQVDPLSEDSRDFTFGASHKPSADWEEGEYEAELRINDEVVDRYPFTISASSAPIIASPGDIINTPELGDLAPYTAKNSLFTINVPTTWNVQTKEDQTSVLASWEDPNNDRGIVISIGEMGTEVTIDDAVKTAIETIEKEYGQEPGYVLSETEEQTDGSVLIPWNYIISTPNGDVEVSMTQYVEVRGTKVSTLTFVMPESEYDTLWAGGFETVANSYIIDPSVKIGR